MNFINIFKPLGITLLVSILSGLGGMLVGLNFLGIFLFVSCLQFILFSFLGEIIKHYISEDRKKKELDKLESLSTILECAYCHKQNLMTFNPDDVERIEFECDHCKKRNLVTMQFVVAQISQPLEIPKVTGIPSGSE